MTSLRYAVGALSLAVLAACSSAPKYTLPEPLPEALEWAAESQRDAGASLGLKTRENDSGSLDALSFDPGVRVVRVVENSPGDKAGFEVGDVVLGWSGSEVNDPGALDELLRRATPGVEVRIEVRRDDTVFEVPVVLAGAEGQSTAEVEALYVRDVARTAAGWADGGGGAVLVSAHAKSPVSKAGIEIGSVVTSVDGDEVLSARDLVRRLYAAGQGAKVRLAGSRPNGEPFEEAVTLRESPRVVTGYNIPIVIHYSKDLDHDTTEFAVLDLWFISLFRYLRDGNEREYRILRWIRFSTGKGELTE